MAAAKMPVLPEDVERVYHAPRGKAIMPFERLDNRTGQVTVYKRKRGPRTPEEEKILLDLMMKEFQKLVAEHRPRFKIVAHLEHCARYHMWKKYYFKPWRDIPKKTKEDLPNKLTPEVTRIRQTMPWYWKGLEEYDQRQFPKNWKMYKDTPLVPETVVANGKTQSRLMDDLDEAQNTILNQKALIVSINSELEIANNQTKSAVTAAERSEAENLEARQRARIANGKLALAEAACKHRTDLAGLSTRLVKSEASLAALQKEENLWKLGKQNLRLNAKALRAKKEDSDKRNTILNEKHQLLETQKSKLEEELVSLKEQVARMEQQLESAQSMHERDREGWEREAEKYNSTASQLRLAKFKTQKENDDLKVVLQMANAESARQGKAFGEHIATLETKLIQAKADSETQVATYNKQYPSLKEEIKSLREQMKTTRAEVEAQKQKLAVVSTPSQKTGVSFGIDKASSSVAGPCSFNKLAKAIEEHDTNPPKPKKSFLQLSELEMTNVHRAEEKKLDSMKRREEELEGERRKEVNRHNKEKEFHYGRLADFKREQERLREEIRELWDEHEDHTNVLSAKRREIDRERKKRKFGAYREA